MRRYGPLRIFRLLLLAACLGFALCVHGARLLRKADSIEPLDKDDGKAIARKAVTKFCNKKKFPYIKCLRNDDGTPITFGGTFGMGVVAHILNQPKAYGFSIYANCKVDYKKAEVNPPPVCAEENLVDPVKWPKIITFIKVIQKTAETSEKYAFNRNTTAIDKEQRRARAIARQGLGPEVYDLLDTRMQRLSVIHDSAYIMQHLQGSSAFEIFTKLDESMLWAITNGLPPIYDAYKAHGIKKLKSAITRVKCELWLRARYYLSVVDVILSFTYHMWKMDIRHCDYHLSNIFLLRERVDLNDEFMRLLRSGAAAAPDDMKEIHLGSSLDQLQQSSISDGVNVFRLHINRVKLIDCAHAVVLAGKVEEEEGRENVETPCYFYTARRSEDTYELWRTMRRIQRMGSELPLHYNNIKETSGFYALEKDSRTQVMVHDLQVFVGNLAKLIFNIFTVLIENNRKWKQCVDHILARKQKTEGPECTMQTEMEAMDLAEPRVKSLKRDFTKLMPDFLKQRKYRVYAPDLKITPPDLPTIPGVRSGMKVRFSSGPPSSMISASSKRGESEE